MNQSEKPQPNIEIIPASLEQKATLANLFELYSYDFCEFVDLEIGPDGRFRDVDLDIYWTEPARYPLLVYVDTRLAGFALIDGLPRGSPDAMVWDVAEFFILRGYRRAGIGTEVAHQVWRRFPGALASSRDCFERASVSLLASRNREFCGTKHRCDARDARWQRQAPVLV